MNRHLTVALVAGVLAGAAAAGSTTLTAHAQSAPAQVCRTFTMAQFAGLVAPAGATLPHGASLNGAEVCAPAPTAARTRVGQCWSYAYATLAFAYPHRYLPAADQRDVAGPASQVIVC